MTSLAQVLEQRASGVFRTDRPGDDIHDLAQRAGWRVVDLALTRPTSKTRFLELCKNEFELPNWFGRNWDALADCLDEVQDVEGVVVLLRRAEYLASADREVLRDIFRERVELGRNPFVAVATGA